MTAATRGRRPHGELKQAMRDFLGQHDGPATIKQIKSGVRAAVGDAPSSSYRSALQDVRYFERVQPGVFRLRSNAAGRHD